MNAHGENARGDFVLYLPQIARRPTDNAALAYAIAEANARNVPCVVVESLRPDYPYASDRLHAFVLEGAKDMAAGLAARGVFHAFFLPRTKDEARGVIKEVAARAVMVVSDEYPTFVVPASNAAAAASVSCAFVTIDDCAVVPMSLFPKPETAARTIRPKVLRALDAWLRPIEDPAPRVRAPATLDLPFDAVDVAHANVDALVRSCEVDHEVPRVDEARGGTTVAEDRLDRFLRRRLSTYAVDRNDPSRDGASGLSPYLHFGMISARRVALAAREYGGSADDGREAFLEQLLVRRALSFNFARTSPAHARYESIPAWAKDTLSKHARDDRGEELTPEDLEAARTPDELWNAAQRELRARGTIHGYARMLWGKLPLTWMRDPAAAHAALVHLNDRFALDGRDPNGYANIGWCFGLHDRPWPERKVFGTVRCMTSKSARSKLDFEDYIGRFGS